jgi:hypothetical protein
MSEDRRTFPVVLSAYKVEPDQKGILWTEAQLSLPSLLDLAFFRMAHGLNNEPSARARAEFTLLITDEGSGEVRPLTWWSKGSKTKDFQLLAVVRKIHSRADDVDSLLHLDPECLTLDVAIIHENPLFDGEAQATPGEAFLGALGKMVRQGEGLTVELSSGGQSVTIDAETSRRAREMAGKFSVLDKISEQLGSVPGRLGDALDTVRHADGNQLDGLFGSLGLDWTDWDTHEEAKAHLFGYIGGLTHDALEGWTALWEIEAVQRPATPA